jgi:hypothetical protein
MDLRYSGITGGLIEAADIKEERGCTYAEALEIQQQRADERAQAYRDADAEIESNVIQFCPRARGK